MTQNKVVHRKFEKIKCLALVRDGLLVFAVAGASDLFIYDIAKDQEILKVNNVSLKGTYTSLIPVKVDPKVKLRWNLYVMKDLEKMSLIAINMEERRTEEISIGNIKGFWAMRNSIVAEW